MTLNKAVTFDLLSGINPANKATIPLLCNCDGSGFLSVWGWGQADGVCRVSCMLIAWTGALVNGTNGYPSIKDSKLRVLKELLTMDFGRKVASQVHYIGDRGSYRMQCGQSYTMAELYLNESTHCFPPPQLIHSLNNHRGASDELQCNC